MPSLFLGGFGNKCALCSSLFKRAGIHSRSRFKKTTLDEVFFGFLGLEPNSVVTYALLEVWLLENQNTVNYCDWTKKKKKKHWKIWKQKKTEEMFNNLENHFTSVCLFFIVYIVLKGKWGEYYSWHPRRQIECLLTNRLVSRDLLDPNHNK